MGGRAVCRLFKAEILPLITQIVGEFPSGCSCRRLGSVASVAGVVKDAKPHVAVGMSGGVDSSVAALLLQRQGFRVTGLYMRNWDPQDEQGSQTCTAEQDYKDAKVVCDQLGINLIHVDYHQQYWCHVFEPLTNDYALGLTPNPDLHCNKYIKFGALLKYARYIGAEKLATGHYARVHIDQQGKVHLLRGVDGEKDQSYFLASVNGSAFEHVLFPVGTFVKSEVRKIAASAGLPIARKRSSRGICFVGKRHFPDFISQYIEMTPGPFISVSDSSVVGTHVGIAAYTYGQRARISGAAEAWFVVGKDMKSNKVYVAQGQNHEALFCKSAVADSLFWIAGGPPEVLAAGKPMECLYKARYNQDVGRCVVSFSCAQSSEATKREMGLAGASHRDFQRNNYFQLHGTATQTESTQVLQIRFESPAKAITPGQALVLYDGDVCLGGGVISYPGPSLFEQLQSTCPDSQKVEEAV